MSHPYTQQKWDVIVVGTGMGGGTVGRALAEAGKKVLFVEFGKAGSRTEVNGLSETILPAARLARGLWPHPVSLTLNGDQSEFFAPLGAGVGGSSVFYAATLERPERHDLEATKTQPHPTGGWPISYDEMRPWYDKAARLFKVYGTQDPLSGEPAPALRKAPPYSESEAHWAETLKGIGLHPYHAHTAMAQGAAHDDCLGRKCAKPDCKMDGRSAGVEPALATGNAYLLPEARVTRLLGTQRSVQAIEIQMNGEILKLTADQYVLAAGAYGSPRILLASQNEAWPQGASNASDQVGRNIMFHATEHYAIWPGKRGLDQTPTKAISLRDFYIKDGQRLGTFQSMGIKASYAEIHYFLTQMLARSRYRNMTSARELLRMPALMAEKLFGDAQIFVGLMEDLPYPENRITFDPQKPDHIQIEYSFHQEFLDRRRAFRRAIWQGTKGLRRVPLGLAPQLNFGHPCGSLKSGEDARNSVLNPDCRSHELDNLWVADASFMPTSMGVNPSLTIAAVALRVADQLMKTTPPDKER